MTEWPSAEVTFKLRYKGQEEINLVRTEGVHSRPANR